jgi:hypothetical protein
LTKWDTFSRMCKFQAWEEFEDSKVFNTKRFMKVTFDIVDLIHS